MFKLSDIFWKSSTGELYIFKFYFPKLEQLQNIFENSKVSDGDLISKPDRTLLVVEGNIVRVGGYNICTKEGVRLAKNTRVLFIVWKSLRQLKWKIKERMKCDSVSRNSAD